MTPRTVQVTPAGRRVVRSAPRRAGSGLERSLGAEIVHHLGPFGLSLLCHLVFIFLLSLSGWAVGVTGSRMNSEFTARVVAQTAPTEQTGNFIFPGKANVDRPDSRQAGQSDSDDSIQDLSSLLKNEKSLQVQAVDVGSSGLNSIAVEELRQGDIVASGAAVGVAGSSDGQGSGLGDRDVAGGGPISGMWGVGKGQQARSIIYVMDRSGSMSDTFSALQRELMRAIGALDADQMFNVIWFNQGQATEWSTRLRQATVDNKRAAFDAIKRIVPEGQTEPLDAIRKALGYRPDVMFLLSDGDFGEDNEKIIAQIKQRNRGNRTIVNTILFIYDTMGKGERVLRSIAESNGGSFKHVTQADVNRS